MIEIGRRGFLGGLAATLFAPAVVRAGNIMPVRNPPLIVPAQSVLLPSKKRWMVTGWCDHAHFDFPAPNEVLPMTRVTLVEFIGEIPASAVHEIAPLDGHVTVNSEPIMGIYGMHWIEQPAIAEVMVDQATANRLKEAMMNGMISGDPVGLFVDPGEKGLLGHAIRDYRRGI